MAVVVSQKVKNYLPPQKIYEPSVISQDTKNSLWPDPRPKNFIFYILAEDFEFL